ncbi:hypothetical protein GCM10022393_30760 [Aquimarina addita]|uniref:OmpA-like domain-containing protein n=1 Tax=Aquimarina addita TaxID=870485 RepID=A0ABP6UR85_9FLAO
MHIPKPTLHFLLTILFVIGVQYTNNAQNLIPNPSFEKTNPAVKKLIHEMRNFGVVSDWKALTNSPDAHHPFVNEVNFDHKAPNFLKQFGPQEPRTGEGQVGIYIAGNNTKESFTAKLNSPLKAGKYYYFHMYVSLSEGLSNSCTSSIGSYFTARVPRITETSKYNLHIESSKLICDTKGWTKVCGIYKAKGTEKYISIGYFSDSPKGKSVKGGGFENAYYFVDDLELLEMRSVSNLVESDVCNMALDFSDVEYLIGESEVYQEIKKELDSYLQYLKIFKVNRVQIIGHANDSEISFENEILSYARAGFVKAYLIENGIDETLIESTGVANTQPQDDPEIDNTELGSNARVQIIIE